MGLETIYRLKCDRCGHTVNIAPKLGTSIFENIAPKCGTSIFEAVEEANKTSPGWNIVRDEMVVCPDCNLAYKEMQRKHEDDFKEFFHIKD